MKKSISIVPLMLIAIAAQAQITISIANYSAIPLSTDTFRSLSTGYPTLATNGSWDLSGVSYTPGNYTTTKSPYFGPSVPFVGYTIPGAYTFSAFSYYTEIIHGFDAQGITQLGELIPRQSFSLAAATGNTQDSLVFPMQRIAYSAPRTLLAFPAQFGNTWTSVLDVATSLQTTVALLGLNNASGYRRTHIVQRDSVKGWGKMRVQTLAGTTSGWMNVLAVKTSVEIVDSFYVNGAPANTALLTGLGLSQGMVTRGYHTSYYRAGEIEPILYIKYTDAAYTNVQTADVHMNRLPKATASVSIAPTLHSLNFYPNPATTGNDLTIELAEAGLGAWDYTLLNTSGQVISRAPLRFDGGKGRISIQNAAPGSYILSVNKDGQPVSTQHVMIKN